MSLNQFSECIEKLEKFFSTIDKKEVIEKFCYELLESGNNVKNECSLFNVNPHIYDKKMVEFYSKSDSFIYELIADSLKIDKINKDKFILKKIKDYYSSNKNINILCYGDGIGSDSIKFSKAGYKPSYFDVEGITSDFAKFNFERSGTLNLINIHKNEDSIPKNYFDIIICREVLEHLEEPFKTVEKLRSFTKNNGLCFISESFGLITPQFPTHLKSNLKYVNKTIDLIVDLGFNFIEKYNTSRLYVFSKTKTSNNNRFSTKPKLNLKQIIKKKIKTKIDYILS